jgi:group II intron reverse transcriptase/maturase
MKRKSKDGKQIKMFDNYHRALSHEGGSGTAKDTGGVVNFLSELREQRALTGTLLTKIMDYENLVEAFKQVKGNKGSGGVDGMGIKEAEEWIPNNVKGLRRSVLEGTYKVQGIRVVEIPKDSGGMRELGIPTVIDRMIQQAIHQRLSPLYDRHFSESSYGFRPNRNAHMAIRQASEYVASGLEWVVDMDLEKYFDTIPHDRLMQRISKGIGDKRLLRLIHQYLKAGMLEGGLASQRIAGSPQGGPLSPLLSNIVLDELDKELEKRGHRFCRYADDCNIFVGSKKAGERVMASIIEFVESRLKLRVNRTKSGVRHCGEVKFLGYTIESGGKIRVADKSIKRMKRKIIKITKRNRGVRFKQVIEELNWVIQGWGVYYSLAEIYLSEIRMIDGWIRRRLRCYRLKQCGRTYSIVKYLRSLEIPENQCWNAAYYISSWWRMTLYPPISHAMGRRWFEMQGLKRLHVIMSRYNNY